MLKRGNMDKQDSNIGVDFHFDTTPETTTLIYLSTIFGIELLPLLLLYDKYGNDIFYFFTIFSEKKLKIPTAKKLHKIIMTSKNMSNLIQNKTIKQEKKAKEPTKQEKVVMERLNQIYNPEYMEYVIRIKSKLEDLKL
jgi:hypothetical protein